MSVSSEQERTGCEMVWENDFLELFHNKDLNMGVCVANAEYIPIEDFKEAFTKAAEIAEQKKWRGFIFDKTALTTFHQPSMEWYYTTWKQQLLTFGLNKHYKILPTMPWFKTSVDAGLEEIKAKHPNFDFTQIEVKYINSIDDLLK